LCLMWCICGEHNAMSFEDREALVLELKNILFKSLYTWIATFNSLSFSNFTGFFRVLFFFFFFFLFHFWGFFCIFPVH
jgi:hypothetical protein